MIVCDSSVALR